jgi:hypothetical protein
MSVNYHKKALEILVNVHVDHEPMLRWIAVHNPAAFVAAFEATRAARSENTVESVMQAASRAA